MAFEEIIKCFKYFESYSVFLSAKNHGIVFNAKDITYEELQAFDIIKEVINVK